MIPSAARAGGRILSAFVITASSLLMAADANSGGEEHPESGWRSIIGQLQSVKQEQADVLSEIHAELVGRAQVEDPDLLPRLRPEPPKPRPHGYGLLPEILPNSDGAPKEPRRTAYSLRELEQWYMKALERTGALADGAKDAELVHAVERYETERKTFRNLEKHLAYHDFWQNAAIENKIFFNKKRELLAVAEAWSIDGQKSGEPFPRAVIDALAPFQPSSRVTLSRPRPDAYVLTVPVLTDITETSFLEDFTSCVEGEFEGAISSEGASFVLDIQLRTISTNELYDSVPPKPGQIIDTKSHVARFPAGELIVTTGARSTHAFVARAVVLGSKSLSCRTLSHEFCHLLGFNDAYLRAPLDQADGDYGVVFVEWSGLSKNLMGAPGTGTIDRSMIDRLIQAYSSPAERLSQN